MKDIANCVFIILLTETIRIQGYAFYQERIPNGDKVPHPCKPNYLWHGVGHMNVAGGGERNSFGKDFARNGYKWDSCICEKDSDGDGRTNGEELGDPDCEWSEGETPKITEYSEITHPGICESLDDPKCQEHNDWEFCEYEEFSCEAFDAEDVRNITLRFPPTTVPTEETTYMCMAFAVPDDAEFHVIGNLGVVDNIHVVHHMRANGCDQNNGPKMLEFFNEPRPCSDNPQMINQQCPTEIGRWTVGIIGDCYDEAFGIRMGANAVKVIVLEFHWNNPEKKAGYVDSSGITLMYTENLRLNDATMFNVGSALIEIPPGAKSHTEVGYCNADCTASILQTPVYIPRILPHMHYLGRSLVLEQWRNGELHREILSDQNFRYDSPKDFFYNPPVEVLPGDSFRVYCHFNSMNQDEFTYFGEGTYDEMCFARMTVYPADSTFPACISFGSEDNVMCSNNEDPIGTVNPTCNYTTYFQKHFQSHFMTLAASCDSEGKECKPNCEQTIAGVINSHVCFEGNSLNITKMLLSATPNAKLFVKMLTSCYKRPVESNEVTDDDRDNAATPLCSDDTDYASLGVTLRVSSIPLCTILPMWLLCLR